MNGAARIGRNDQCPCGSGRKYKACCGSGSAIRTPGQPWQGSSLTDIGRSLERFSPLRRAIERADTARPETARSHYRRGLVLQQRGDLAAAIAEFAAAAELAPNHFETHETLGNLLYLTRRRDDAGVAFRKAAAAQPRSTGGRIAAAKAQFIADDFAAAEVSARRAVALDPRHAEANRMLGTILAASGRFDEAAGYFERAIDVDPLPVAALYELLRSRRITPADAIWIDKAEQCVAAETLIRQQRMALHFALGKAYDDLGDYAAAMRHFDSANAIRHHGEPLDRGMMADRIDQVIARFTPDFIAAHRDQGSQDETPVFIVGMPRSGTTLIEQIVSSHPAVAAGGELPFWNHCGPRWLEGHIAIDQAAGECIAMLRGISGDAHRVIDKNPFNFFWLGLIHLALPRARIIHCRRHPIDTCLSIYTTHFTTRMEFASDRGDLVFAYRQYQRAMDHWRAVLPAGCLMDMQYEALVSDREAAARRLVEFSGLPWDARCLHPERNRRVVRTASVWQVRQPIYTSSVARWRRYEPWLGELRSLQDDAGSIVMEDRA